MTSSVRSALFACSVFSSLIPDGTFFDRPNSAAAATNSAPTAVYRITTLLSGSAVI